MKYLLTALAALLIWQTPVVVNGINEYARIKAGQACVDTATARGWLPAKEKK